MRAAGLLVIVAITVGCLSATQPPSSRLGPSLPAALLLDDPFPALHVEVDHVEGYEPAALAMQALEETLREVVNKDRVLISSPGDVPLQPEDRGPDREWTVAELVELHRRTFSAGPVDRFGADGTAFLHVLYLNGAALNDEGERVAGSAIGNALFVFPDTIDGMLVWVGPYSPPNVVGDQMERSILVHELGHALGLVNNGVPMVHAREGDRHHSRYEESVMYPAVRGGLLELVQDNQHIPYRFDRYDLQDLAAFRDAGR